MAVCTVRSVEIYRLPVTRNPEIHRRTIKSTVICWPPYIPATPVYTVWARRASRANTMLTAHTLSASVGKHAKPFVGVVHGSTAKALCLYPHSLERKQ